jgi:hypothetical protein
MSVEELSEKLRHLSTDELNEALGKRIASMSKEEKEALVRTSNPKASFCKVKLSHCKRQDGLGLDLTFLEPSWKMNQPSITLPNSIQNLQVIPSDWLCETLKRLWDVWSFNNEKACRIIIDSIITEVIYKSKSDDSANLKAYCEKSNPWDGAGFSYTGNVDYMIGSSDSDDPDIDTMLLCEAKKAWDETTDTPQILAQLGCLLKQRLAAKPPKQTPVLGMLSNGVFFRCRLYNARFFAINTSGVVFCSGAPISLAPHADGVWKESSSLIEVLRWLYWCIESMKTSSPRVSTVDLTENEQEAAIKDIMECFKK